MQSSEFDIAIRSSCRHGLQIYREIFPAILALADGQTPVSSSWLGSLRSMAQASALTLASALRALAEAEENGELPAAPPQRLRRALAEVTFSFLLISQATDAEQLASQPLYQAAEVELALDDDQAAAWLGS